jgi:hypothetical protein
MAWYLLKHMVNFLPFTCDDIRVWYFYRNTRFFHITLDCQLPHVVTHNSESFVYYHSLKLEPQFSNTRPRKQSYNATYKYFSGEVYGTINFQTRTTPLWQAYVTTCSVTLRSSSATPTHSHTHARTHAHTYTQIHTKVTFNLSWTPPLSRQLDNAKPENFQWSTSTDASRPYYMIRRIRHIIQDFLQR